MKRCPRCKSTKPLEEFYPNSIFRDGHNRICKQCQLSAGRALNYMPDTTLTHKRCIKCRLDKGIDHFWASKRQKDGYQIYCNDCSKSNTLKRRFRVWKYGAKHRGLEFSLTFNDIESLPQMCYYTQIPLTVEPNHNHTLSLDRVDSSKGYIKDNVVFCCSFINLMKGKLSYEQFINACRNIVIIHDGRKINYE
jgi:hypothetical protein